MSPQLTTKYTIVAYMKKNCDVLPMRYEDKINVDIGRNRTDIIISDRCKTFSRRDMSTFLDIGH